VSEPDLWAALGAHMDNPIVLGLVLVAGIFLFVSKRLAEIRGTFAWIGSLARWWNGRQKRRVLADAELWKVTRSTSEERDAIELTQLRLDVDYLRRELDDMRRREQLRDRQARAHTAWDNVWVPKAQAAGIAIPEPPPLYLDLAPLYIPEEGTR
jgi:hypothetical protein